MTEDKIRKKVLWVGNVPSHLGGQNRVAHYSIKNLVSLGWDVVCCGKGHQAYSGDEKSPCQCYPFDEHRPETLFNAIEAAKPDVLLFSHDIWLFYMLPELKQKFPNIPIVGWWTIDAHPIHRSWIPLLKACDRIITPTEFGKAVIYESYPEKPVTVVQYGVDREVYRFPKESRRSLREKAVKTIGLPPGIEDACVFTFIGNNQIKKNIGAMVDAFSTGNFPNAILILAVKSYINQIGTFQYEGEYDLGGLVHHPRIVVIDSLLDNEAHARLLQISDFFLYPSQGEAPGLQMLESQLCGCIPIATNYSGLPEETSFEEFLIDNFQLHRGQFNCYRAMVSAEALQDRMNLAYGTWLRSKGDMLPYVKDRLSRKTKLNYYRTWIRTALDLDKELRLAILKCQTYDQDIVSI